jgi:V/A-type H+-transporting ATPase subunit C
LAQTTKYASLQSKIGAERSRLLNEAKLKLLSETKKMVEFVGALRETTYGEKIAISASIGGMERVFRENQIEVLIKIVENSPSSISAYLKTYVRSYEIENIKNLMRSILARLDSEQKRAKIYLRTEIVLRNSRAFEDAINAHDLKQFSDAFKKTEYASAVSQGIKSYEESASGACFDVLIDKVFYENLYLTYNQLPKKEKKHAFFYADLESSSFILLMLLRAKYLKYDSSWLRVAVPDHHFLQEEIVESLVTSQDFNSAFAIVLKSSYGKFFTKTRSPNESISMAEKLFRKTLYEHAQKSHITEEFNIGLPLSFIYLKEAEVRDLVRLCVSLE